MRNACIIAAALALFTAACGEANRTSDVHEVDLRGEDGGELPRLDDPFSPEDTRELREGFDWAMTEELPETDPDGRIALRYAIAYIATEEERVLLDAVGPHSPLPMFAVERERWEEQAGRFGFFGDGEGLFHFVILPASTYNLLREVALDGTPPFQALILRDPPLPEIDNGDGSLDHQWLADRGFRLSDDEPGPAPEDDPGVGARREPLLGLLVVLLSREARDVVDDGLGTLSRLGRAGTNEVTLELGSTDPLHAGVTRAWGRSGPVGTNAGDPLVLRGVEVVGELEVGTSRGRTNDDGTVTIAVPVGGRVHYCVRAENFAVQVDEGFEASQICNFRMSASSRIRDAVDGAAVTVRVADPVFNIVAQMTDANDYARRVMGHEVSHQAGVLIGPFADVFGAVNGNRAFVLCGGYTSGLNARWDLAATGLSAIISADPVSGLVGRALVYKILSHDVVFPAHGSESAAYSRIAPTHEYGHFLQCDMMSVLGGHGDFTEGWGDVIDTTLLGGPPTASSDVLVLTEGIADYFAAQIAGGFDYFRGVESSGFDDDDSFYCSPTATTCLEDNIGGPSQAVTLTQVSRAEDPITRRFHQEIGMVATLLTDAVDGNGRVLPPGVSDAAPAGAFWEHDPATLQLVPSSTFPSTSSLDELVSLSGAFMPDTFREMSVMGNTLNRDNFFGALARVSRRDHSDVQVCDMFALHSPNGMCTGLAPAEELMDGPVAPTMPVIFSGSVNEFNSGVWQWTDLSSAATGFIAELVLADGSLAGPRRTLTYTRRMASIHSNLDYDSAYTFRVATTNRGTTGPFAEHTVHTYAEPVSVAVGTALRGAVRLTWDPVEATEYTVHDVTDGGDVIVARTTGAVARIRGLAGGVERRYVVVSHNAIGLPSDASLPVTVTPLDANVVYAASSGDDTHPSAGSAAHPFRTFTAALARAAAISADELILEGTSFTETGPILIDEAITIRGGFSLVGGAWHDAGGQTQVSVFGGASAASCRTDSFNASGRETSAALLIAPRADVSMRNVEIVANRAPGMASRCFAAIHVRDAVLDIDAGQVTTVGSSTSACAAGIVLTRAGSANIRDSFVRGADFTSTSIPRDYDAAGIVGCEGATMMVEDSAIAGIEAPDLSRASIVGALVGVAGDNLDSVRVQRSAIEAIAQDYGWHAAGGRLSGIQVTATGRVFIANSIVRTAHGGDINHAVAVGSRVGPLSSFQLYHVTAAVGDDWDAAAPVPLPFDGAVVSLSGDIIDVAMFNNLLSFAGGGVDRVSGTTFTGIDRVDTTEDPLTFAFMGNVVSVPYVADWHKSSLATCGSWEFATIRSEWQLNEAVAHECHAGTRSSWNVARNAAFTSPTGFGPRAVVQLTADGHTTAPLATFVVGEPVMTLPRGDEVVTDIEGMPRTAPPGVGAWR